MGVLADLASLRRQQSHRCEWYSAAYRRSPTFVITWQTCRQLLSFIFLRSSFRSSLSFIALRTQAITSISSSRKAILTIVVDEYRDGDIGQASYFDNHNMDPAVVDSPQFGLLWKVPFNNKELCKSCTRITMRTKAHTVI